MPSHAQREREREREQVREGKALTFAIKRMMYGCLLYLIPSHAVLLAERPAVFKPAQLGPGVASCSTAELDCVGSWHRVQLLFHLRRRGPIRGACNRREQLVLGQDLLNHVFGINGSASGSRAVWGRHRRRVTAQGPWLNRS